MRPRGVLQQCEAKGCGPFEARAGLRWFTRMNPPKALSTKDAKKTCLCSCFSCIARTLFSFLMGYSFSGITLCLLRWPDSCFHLAVVCKPDGLGGDNCDCRRCPHIKGLKPKGAEGMQEIRNHQPHRGPFKGKAAKLAFHVLVLRLGKPCRLTVQQGGVIAFDEMAANAPDPLPDGSHARFKAPPPGICLSGGKP